MANGEVIQEIRTLLATGAEITTEAAMRLTLAVVDELHTANAKQDKQLEALDKRVRRLEPVYGVVLWVGGAVGLAIIGFFGALITGRAQITFLGGP